MLTSRTDGRAPLARPTPQPFRQPNQPAARPTPPPPPPPPAFPPAKPAGCESDDHHHRHDTPTHGAIVCESRLTSAEVWPVIRFGSSIYVRDTHSAGTV